MYNGPTKPGVDVTPPFEILPLADRPELVPALAAGLLEEWRLVLPEHTQETREARLRAHLNRDTLPITLVAVAADGSLAGTASLRATDLHGREALGPWLGGVWVAPQHRRLGVGADLVRAIEALATGLGYRELYLFTLDREAWYVALGWATVEPIDWRGRAGVLMTRRLDAITAPG
jgi:N-acetylglutamate synthase-like GNAT family acetyltransferase